MSEQSFTIEACADSATSEAMEGLPVISNFLEMHNVPIAPPSGAWQSHQTDGAIQIKDQSYLLKQDVLCPPW